MPNPRGRPLFYHDNAERPQLVAMKIPAPLARDLRRLAEARNLSITAVLLTGLRLALEDEQVKLETKRITDQLTTATAEMAVLQSELRKSQATQSRARRDFERVQSERDTAKRECKQVRKEYEDFKCDHQDCDYKKRMKDAWLRAMQVHDLTPQTLIRDLIAMAHPDKWHNKPATDLSHELIVKLLPLRR